MTRPESSPTPRARASPDAALDHQPAGPASAEDPDFPAALDPLPQHRLERGAAGGHRHEVGVGGVGGAAGNTGRPGLGEGQLPAPGGSQVGEHVGGLGRQQRAAAGQERVRVAGLRGGPARRAPGVLVERVGSHFGRAPRPHRGVGLDHQDVDPPSGEGDGGHQAGDAGPHDNHVGVGTVTVPGAVGRGHTASQAPRR